MGSEKGSPFYGFRFSSSTSIDVKVSNDPEIWSGLVSICDVSIDELIRQSKTAFQDKYKQLFLAELPRMLTWGGSTEPRTESETGEVNFTDGQIIMCELEDGKSGEIEEKKITCSADKYEATVKQSFELLNNASEEVTEMPRVGLDAAGDHDHEGEEEEEHTEDEEDDHADDDEDFKNGLGQDLRPTEVVKEQTFKSQLKATIATAKLLGLQNPDIREAWTSAGGVIPEGVFTEEAEAPQQEGGGGGCKAQ